MGERIDVLLVKIGLARSRTYAQQLIESGKVYVNGVNISKNSIEYDDTADIKVADNEKQYVSRGYIKLEHAVKSFDINIKGKVCIDIGASTGGFTQCMLDRGAKKVYAVDVGTSQLAAELYNNPQVVPLEKLDIRKADKNNIPERAEFVTIDVSFISLSLVIPAAVKFMAKRCLCVFLIKPQFEAGRKNVGKNGIVKSEQVRLQTVNTIKTFCEQSGFDVKGCLQSPITGGSGNMEYLLYLETNN